jgi:hypothetical protein
MSWLQAARRWRGARFPVLSAMALGLTGCMHAPIVNPFAAGGVNPDSTVAAETVAVSRAPGAFPRFTQVPAVPTDVRPIADWRTAVVGEWRVKTKTEHEAAAIPFTLANTEDWAQRTRKKIPADQTVPPAVSATQQIEAFAATERARATPPPPPQ